MVEGPEVVDFVKIQKRIGGSDLLPIPAEAVKALGIKDIERVKVYVDRRTKDIIFDLLG